VTPGELAIPLRAAISDDGGESSDTVNVPVEAVPGGLPGAGGAKASENAQLLPDMSVPHVPKELKPELVAKPEIARLEPKSAEAVNVIVWGALVVPASWLPNASAGGTTIAPPTLIDGGLSGTFEVGGFSSMKKVKVSPAGIDGTVITRFPAITSKLRLRLSTSVCARFCVHNMLLVAPEVPHSSTPNSGDPEALNAAPDKPLKVSTKLLGPEAIWYRKR
jgi:hypothetical protein